MWPESDSTVSGKTRSWYVLQKWSFLETKKLSHLNHRKVYQRPPWKFESAAINLMKTTMAAHDRTMLGSWWRKALCLPKFKSIFKRHQGEVLKKRKKMIRKSIYNRGQSWATKNNRRKPLKTYFFWKRRSFQAHNQPHMLPFDSNQSCAKEWKKDEKFIEFIEFFDTKNDRPKRVKTNNQTYLATLERSIAS